MVARQCVEVVNQSVIVTKNVVSNQPEMSDEQKRALDMVPVSNCENPDVKSGSPKCVSKTPDQMCSIEVAMTGRERYPSYTAMGKHEYPMDGMLRQISGEVRSAYERDKRRSEMNLSARDGDDEQHNIRSKVVGLKQKNCVSMCDLSAEERAPYSWPMHGSSLDKRNRLQSSCAENSRRTMDTIPRRKTHTRHGSSTSKGELNTELPRGMSDCGRRKRISGSIASFHERANSFCKNLIRQRSVDRESLNNNSENDSTVSRQCLDFGELDENEPLFDHRVQQSSKLTNLIVTCATVERDESLSFTESDTSVSVCDRTPVIFTDTNLTVADDEEDLPLSSTFDVADVQFDRPFGGFENFAQEFDRLVQNKSIDTTVLMDLLDIDSVELADPYAQPKRCESPHPQSRGRFKQFVGRVVSENNANLDFDRVALNNNNEKLSFHIKTDLESVRNSEEGTVRNVDSEISQNTDTSGSNTQVWV